MKTSARIAWISIVGIAAIAYCWQRDPSERQAPLTLGSRSSESVEFLARVPLTDGGARSAMDSAPAAIGARHAAFEALKQSFVGQDSAGAGRAIEAWFAAEPRPVEAILSMVADPSLDQLDAEMAGILLQAAMLHARSGSAHVRPWTMSEIASSAVALADTGPRSSRMLLVGLKPFGGELPASCLVDLLHAARGETLQFTNFEAQESALELVREWSRTMPQEVEVALYAMVADPKESSFARGDAIGGLLARDWRAFGPELARVLREQRSTLGDEARNQIVLNLTAPTLQLTENQRIELLRDVVADDDVTIQALSLMDRDDAVALAASVVRKPGDWSGYDWLEMRSRGSGWVDAGLRLLQRYESGSNRFVAYSVLEELITAAGDDPLVAKAVEARFERRAQNGDPFWGAVAFNFDNLPRNVLATSVRSWLVRTRGEKHPQRSEVLRKLQILAPELAEGIS